MRVGLYRQARRSLSWQADVVCGFGRAGDGTMRLAEFGVSLLQLDMSLRAKLRSKSYRSVRRGVLGLSVVGIGPPE